uniref:Uncharacterized protein n=1 Tax=Rhizophora mucronata TaxID=61149 RepID=A0A2P2IWH0_RHIMU
MLFLVLIIIFSCIHMEIIIIFTIITEGKPKNAMRHKNLFERRKLQD